MTNPAGDPSSLFPSPEEEEAVWNEWAGCYVALREIENEVEAYLEACEDLEETPSLKRLAAWRTQREVFEERFRAVDQDLPDVLRLGWLEQVS